MELLYQTVLGLTSFLFAYIIVIKEVTRENRIPFAISRESDPFYSEVNQAYVLKSIQELREGKGNPLEFIGMSAKNNLPRD